MKRGDKVKKNRLVILCALFLGFMLIPLMGCAEGTAVNNNLSTYDSLSEAQKKEVDFILDNIPETISDSGSTFSIRIIKIYTEDSKKTLAVAYATNGSDVIIEDQYEYSVSSNSFSKTKRTGIGGGTISPLYKQEWDDSWSVDQKRDYLSGKIK